MRRFRSTCSTFFAWWHSNSHAALIFGAILIAVAWIAVRASIDNKNEELRNDALSDVTNFTVLFEQDALQTAKELDRIILYLRRSYERGGFQVDWSSLVSEKFTTSSRTVQIAILDADGRMITSSAMLHPDRVIDHADRDHFKVHAASLQDDLFISKPVKARASGQWSIQFTRRFSGADGRFGGVIVVSLNPNLLVGNFTQIQSLQNAGFALIGFDDVIRAGAGLYADAVGRSYREGANRVSLATRSPTIQAWREIYGGQPRLVASMPVGDLPLSVIVSIEDSTASAARLASTRRTYLWTTIFSAIVLFASVNSVLRERRHVRRITLLAHNDALTGLDNRLSFRDALDRVYAAPPGEMNAALHLIDLDRFKAVNDTYGHPVGDRLLVAVAERLRACTRPPDRIFRLGGDEFAMLQAQCATEAQAETVAQRMCAAMAEPFLIDGLRLEIGASIGIALTHVDATTATGVMQSADLALYLAKADGRGRFRFFNAAMDAEMQVRRRLETELATAASRGELELFYQPKVDATGTCGYEALIRWRHPERGLLPPMDFITLAEDTGLIIPIGEWILQEACTQLASRPGTQTVAVNVSAIQFGRSDVVAAVQRALAVSGLAAGRLEIEITESALMRGEKSVISQLSALRKMGIAIALDDFGTGYSSLSYLHTYPIDCIKIDRSFVRTIGDKNSASPIIRAIVTMAGELNMTTVAEGVETEAQLSALRAIGCEVFQGYYFGKPLPVSEVWPEQRSQARANAVLEPVLEPVAG